MHSPKKYVPQKWLGHVALITGASSGIGAATARLLARQGLLVVLVARRKERLIQLQDEIERAGGKAEAIYADLTHENDRMRLFEHVRAAYPGVDVLINNAGLGWYGYYAEMPWEVASEIVKVNVESVVHLTRLFLPGMQQRRSGHIINVGSIAGGLASQGTAIYAASKSFLDTFTTAVYRELRGSGVNISVLRPGPVTTEFFSSAAGRTAGRKVPAETLAVPPELVADRIWKLIQAPRRVAYVPWYVGVTPWIELLFGRIIDLMGPFLLKRKSFDL